MKALHLLAFPLAAAGCVSFAEKRIEDDVAPSPAAVRRDLSRYLTEGVEREFRRVQRAGGLPSRIDPALLARSLTAMVDRFCYLTYVFDPAPEPVSVEQSVETLLYVWASSLGMEVPGS